MQMLLVVAVNPSMLKCWNCQNLFKNNNFTCSQCNKIIKIAGLDYFQLFQLERDFTLDKALLEKRYISLQRIFHPDKFIGRDEKEKYIATQNTMTINEAYQIFKNERLRAEYLLNIYIGDKLGDNVGDKLGDNELIHDQEFLIQELEKREILESVINSQELEELINNSLAEKKEMVNKLEEKFLIKSYTEIKEILIKLKYLEKFINEAKSAKAKKT